MSLSYADVNVAEIGGLAPMVGGDFHTMHHTRDIFGELEAPSFKQYKNAFAPHIASDILPKAADVSEGAAASTPVAGNTMDFAVDAAAGAVDSGVTSMGNAFGRTLDAAADVGLGAAAAGGALFSSLYGSDGASAPEANIWQTGQDASAAGLPLTPMEKAQSAVDFGQISQIFRMHFATMENELGVDVNRDGLVHGSEINLMANAHLPNLVAGASAGISMMA